MNHSRLAEQLRSHEGYRKHPYRDSEGILTVAYGRNLENVGISRVEARFLLKNDIATAEAACKKRMSFFTDLDDTRQEVLVNMTLNMGWGSLRLFRKMLAALRVEDYELAAAEMLDSRWHRQVKGRARDLAAQMREGEPTPEGVNTEEKEE